MDKKNHITIAIIISLILHIVFLTVVLRYLGMQRDLAKNDKEEVMQVDLGSEQKQIADIPKPAVEQRPEKSKHIGLYDSKVDQETVAADSPRAPGRPKTRGGEGIEKFKPTDEYDIFKQEKKFKKLEEKPGENGSVAKIPEDFYPDYKRGGHTYINVQKHQDVAYFVMLKRIFKLAWDPTESLRRGMSDGVVSRGNIKVVLGLAINGNGNISELFVINSSGIAGYDSEAMRAIRASSPFSAPPKNLLANDGILRISWTFVVYL